jgi:hypothetical protein
VAEAQIEHREGESDVLGDGADGGHEGERLEWLVGHMRAARTKRHQMIEQPDRVEALGISQPRFLQDRVSTPFLVKLDSKLHALDRVSLCQVSMKNSHRVLSTP